MTESNDNQKDTRRRLPREQRERLIIDEAVRFFAEVGFEGQTRALAQRLGVTQPLLYRYFPDKDALIERVYQEVYLSKWNPEWEDLLADRSIPLKERLVNFYQQYTKAIFTYEWVRIFMFSGLKNVSINSRYLSIIGEKVLVPMCREMRLLSELPPAEEVPITEEEKQVAWGLHGGIFYIAIRKYIYNQPVPDDLEPIITAQVSSFIEGLPGAQKHILAGNIRTAAQ